MRDAASTTLYMEFNRLKSHLPRPSRHHLTSTRRRTGVRPCQAGSVGHRISTGIIPASLASPFSPFRTGPESRFNSKEVEVAEL